MRGATFAAALALVAGCREPRVAVLHEKAELRAGPSLGDAVLGSETEDAALPVRGDAKDGWLPVRWQGQKAFVRACLAREIERKAVEEHRSETAAASEAFTAAMAALDGTPGWKEERVRLLEGRPRSRSRPLRTDSMWEAKTALEGILAKQPNTKYAPRAAAALFELDAVAQGGDPIGRLSRVLSFCPELLDPRHLEPARQVAIEMGRLARAVADLPRSADDPRFSAGESGDLFALPDPGGRRVGEVPYAAEVRVRRRFGAWSFVEAGRLSGWCPDADLSVQRPRDISGTYEVLRLGGEPHVTKVEIAQRATKLTGRVLHSDGRTLGATGRFVGDEISLKCNGETGMWCTLDLRERDGAFRGKLVVIEPLARFNNKVNQHFEAGVKLVKK